MHYAGSRYCSNTTPYAKCPWRHCPCQFLGQHMACLRPQKSHVTLPTMKLSARNVTIITPSSLVMRLWPRSLQETCPKLRRRCDLRGNARRKNGKRVYETRDHRSFMGSPNLCLRERELRCWLPFSISRDAFYWQLRAWSGHDGGHDPHLTELRAWSLSDRIAGMIFISPNFHRHCVNFANEGIAFHGREGKSGIKIPYRRILCVTWLWIAMSIGSSVCRYAKP